MERKTYLERRAGYEKKRQFQTEGKGGSAFCMTSVRDDIKDARKDYESVLCSKRSKSKLYDGNGGRSAQNDTGQTRGKDRANIGDCVPILNVGPFGVCKTTQMPCVPACAIWLNGKTNVLVQGLPALLDKSMAICPVGAGVLKLKNDGQ